MKTRAGFTIVELLMVIVVIAVLATVTIVAYNGVQARAKVSALQSTLTQSAKKLEQYKITNADQYPADLATAQANAGIQPGAGASYIVTNTTSTAHYCLTVVDGATKYSITSTSGMPMVGECVTNLIHDPRATSYTSGSVAGWRSTRWFGTAPAAGAYSLVSGAGDGALGIATYARKTWSVAPTSIANQGDTGYTFGPSGTSGFPVTPGDVYVLSAYLRPSSAGAKNSSASVFPYDSAGTSMTRVYGTNVLLPGGGVWTRQAYTYTVGAGTAYFIYVPDINTTSTGATVWAVGDTLDGTAAMITRGSTVYQYGDGNSPGWFWNGTPNASTSTGPAIP